MLNSNETCLLLSIVVNSPRHNKNITTLEKELSSFVKVFKEFCEMLLGSKNIVCTDHQKLTHHVMQFMTFLLLCWCLLIEEFNPKFEYLMGEHNVIADTLSHIPFEEGNTQSVEEINTNTNYEELHMHINDQVKDLLTKPKYHTIKGQAKDLLVKRSMKCSKIITSQQIQYK